MNFSNYPKQFQQRAVLNKQHYPNQIIPPFESKKPAQLKTWTLLVDSRDRNTSRYPTHSTYEYKLKTPYKDVLKVELISACVPSSDYTIHEFNNCFYIKEVANTTTVYDYGDATKIECDIGNYTIQELAAHLQTKLIAVFPNSSYLVVYNSAKDNITIKASVLFQLYFNGGTRPYGEQTYKTVKTNSGLQKIRMGDTDTVYPNNSIGHVLGFDKKNPYGIVNGSVYEAESDSRVNLKDCDNLLLKISQLKRYDSYNSVIQDSFASIPLTSTFTDFIGTEHYGNAKVFHQPLPKLDRLKIKLYRPTGELYNFRGKNHVLVFSIVCLNQSGKYNVELH